MVGVLTGKLIDLNFFKLGQMWSQKNNLMIFSLRQPHGTFCSKVLPVLNTIENCGFVH